MRVSNARQQKMTGRHPLSSAWLQLALYVLAGIIFPVAMRTRFDGARIAQEEATVAIFGICLATIMVWSILNRLRDYAKARLLSYVLPVNFLVFGSLSLVLLVLRLPYNISILLLSALAMTATSFMLIAVTRGNRQRYWVVPGGRAADTLGGLDETILLTPETLREIIGRRMNGSLVADLHHARSEEWDQLIAEAALSGLPVYHYRQVWEYTTGQVKIDHLRENNLGTLIPNIAYMKAKRLIDILLVIVLLPALILILPAVALWVKLDSKGPVFYVQERVGMRGHLFRMYKFRSMLAEPVRDRSDLEAAMTRSDDDRITRAGRIIRRFRIDELPQILNVLKGEMSWIGPRPEALPLSRSYEKAIPFYRYRHIVRPGLTGWAQVNQGHVTDLDEIDDKLGYDFYYIRHFSWWLDALIFLKTFRVIFGGFGAK
ncbi:sugar transferase [Erythrobacteraceae bacterium WH01K]|nr:sugar transferase [Erythrobacteraceae bacterium WH01K]